jgi:D-glycero-alpha-D-manno-heptose-7-phosphate kinase
VIVSSAPLRLSFNGGGSDLPTFTQESDGKVVSVTLDRYVYVTVSKSYSDSFRLAYSQIETEASLSSIKHPIIKACLEKFEVKDFLEVTSVADIPSNGSGLGSSSAFTVALIRALNYYQGIISSEESIARQACEIEIDRCQEPIGMQDQYASAIGGLNSFTFKKDRVVESIKVFQTDTETNEFINQLNMRLSFFQLPLKRNASEILKAQNQKLISAKVNRELTANLASLASDSIDSIRDFNFNKLGKEMTTGWQIKSKLNGDETEKFYADVLEVLQGPGILGGKLLGAGAGGFIAVLSAPNEKENVSSLFKGLREVHFLARNVRPELLEIGRSDYKN